MATAAEILLMQTDEQIIEAARAGDSEAFGEIVRRWERRIFALAYGILGSVEDARDATQETFFAAYRNMHSFRGEARISTWLHRIAVNQCISRTRRTASRPEVELDERENGVSDVVSKHASPIVVAEQGETTDAVRRAVKSLPIELRQVVVMKEFEEMTFQEISDTLGVPLSTVKSRLYTALKQLKMRLAKHAATAIPHGGEISEKIIHSAEVAAR